MSQELKVEKSDGPCIGCSYERSLIKCFASLDSEECIKRWDKWKKLLGEEAKKKPCLHKRTETIDFSHFTGKVYIRCLDCGIVLQGA